MGDYRSRGINGQIEAEGNSGAHIALLSIATAGAFVLLCVTFIWG